MPQLQAIETIYHGYRFRSRLEARWAVFFDALGVKYEYEKEGFALKKAGWYLPDFWLPEQQCWVEIKPDEPSQIEIEKAAALAVSSENDVFILYGPIPINPDTEYPSYERGQKLFGGEGHWDCCYAWNECGVCGRLGIVFQSNPDRLECGHDSGGWDTPRLLKAYESARQARFEHGETPARLRFIPALHIEPPKTPEQRKEREKEMEEQRAKRRELEEEIARRRRADFEIRLAEREQALGLRGPTVQP